MIVLKGLGKLARKVRVIREPPLQAYRIKVLAFLSQETELPRDLTGSGHADVFHEDLDDAPKGGTGRRSRGMGGHNGAPAVDASVP